MVCLPDVNVLVALSWPNHVHHAHARAWFTRAAADGWATCPLTQAGFIRISANAKIIPEAVSPRDAISLLERLTGIGDHQFWTADLSFAEPTSIPTSLLVGHRQVTDAYLLGLAVHHGGTLVTLDRAIADLLPSSSTQHSNLFTIPV